MDWWDELYEKACYDFWEAFYEFFFYASLWVYFSIFFVFFLIFFWFSLLVIVYFEIYNWFEDQLILLKSYLKVNYLNKKITATNSFFELNNLFCIKNTVPGLSSNNNYMTLNDVNLKSNYNKLWGIYHF